VEIDYTRISFGVAGLAVVVWGVEDETDEAGGSCEGGADGFDESGRERTWRSEAVEEHADFHEESPPDGLSVEFHARAVVGHGIVVEWSMTDGISGEIDVF